MNEQDRYAGYNAVFMELGSVIDSWTLFSRRGCYASNAVTTITNDGYVRTRKNGVGSDALPFCQAHP
jgi:hypothetical protein